MANFRENTIIKLKGKTAGVEYSKWKRRKKTKIKKYDVPKMEKTRKELKKKAELEDFKKPKGKELRRKKLF